MSDASLQTRRMEEASEWLICLQEDDLSNDELVRWVDWCEAHPANRETFERLLPLWQAFDAPRALPAVPGPRFRRRRHLALAAAVVVGLAAAVTAFLLTRPPGIRTLDEVAMLRSDTGQIVPVLLSDGSRLDLGARSSLAVDFAGPRRQVDLGEGEAFFAVKADRSRPFVVRAGATEIVAVGTQFNVLNSAGRVVVTVQEGAVKVANPGAPPLLVRAGYQVVRDAIHSSPGLRAIDPASSIAWRAGHLEYIGEPLSSVIGTLNRYLPAGVTIDDAGLGQLNYTGTIEVSSMAEWLQALPGIFPIRIREDEGGGIHIESRS